MTRRGFTLIELLVVIAIIGLLSSVVLASLSSARGRANDARRFSDMRQIQTALALYYSDYGNYPSSNNSGCGGWEATGSNPSTFVAGLVTGRYLPQGFKDPTPSLENTCGNYSYYRYPANYAGCTKPFYVVGIRVTDGNGTTRNPTSPGWSCSGRDWQAEFSWVAGSFE